MSSFLFIGDMSYRFYLVNNIDFQQNKVIDYMLV